MVVAGIHAMESRNANQMYLDIASVPWTQEIRFKSTTKSVEQALISLDNNTWSVTIERTGSYSGSADYGRVNFYINGAGGIVSSSTPYAPIFDGDYWNLRLQTNVIPSNRIQFDRQAIYLLITKLGL
jgi:hypothetical protein